MLLRRSVEDLVDQILFEADDSLSSALVILYRFRDEDYMIVSSLYGDLYGSARGWFVYLSNLYRDAESALVSLFS